MSNRVDAHNKKKDGSNIELVVRFALLAAC
jgi:hypothetical protein